MRKGVPKINKLYTGFISFYTEKMTENKNKFYGKTLS